VVIQSGPALSQHGRLLNNETLFSAGDVVQMRTRISHQRLSNEGARDVEVGFISV